MKIKIYIFLLIVMMVGVVQINNAQETRSSAAISVTYDFVPVNLQFFGRDNKDSAAINIYGKILTTGYDSVQVEVLRNGTSFTKQSKVLTYVSGISDFSLTPKIYADTVSFDLNIYFLKGNSVELHRKVTNLVCGDVFIVHGQSNAWAEDYDNVEVYQSNWIRTLGRTAWYNRETPLDITDSSWYIAQGHSTNTQAAIGVYALELARLIVENHGIPVCVFNGSGGGGAISKYQRDDANPMNLDKVYGRLLYRLKKANLTGNVKIITWNQGESESGTGYLTYPNDFNELYTDLNEDYPNVEKMYLFQIPPGCVSNLQADKLREVQRLLPKAYDDVEIMSRCGLPGHDYDDCHYHYNGYATMAYWSYRQISRDFYGVNWDYNVNPPMIQKCGYISQDEIALVFDQPVRITNDTTVQGNSYYLKDHIYFDGQFGFVTNMSTSGDTVFLKINSNQKFSKISYTPNKFYNYTTKVYEGPWIKGTNNNVGALTFFQFPVEDLITGIGFYENTNRINIYPNPADDTIYVDLHFDKPTDVVIEISDSIGNKLIREDLHKMRGELIPLNTNALTNGLYIVRALFNSQSFSQKIVVNR